MHSSLTLGAILIYMLNALSYRPAEGQRETDLTHTCCWNVYEDDTDSDIVDSDEDEDPIPALLRCGLYFISGVRIQDGGALRMGGGDTVSRESILRLYNIRDDRDLTVAFCVKTWQHDPSAKNTRTQNRRRVPVDVRLVASREELVAQDTPLADLGIVATVPHREAGPDIVALREDPMDEDEGGRQESVDDLLARIWRQFPYDLLDNAPNHRCSQQGSHLILSKKDRAEATIEVFRNTNLCRLFSRVVVKIVTPEKWEGLEFKRYFPAKGFIAPAKFQNFTRLRYFQEWNALMADLSADNARVVRQSAWNTFNTFKWLPLTDADRLWNTKKVKPGPEWVHLPHDDNKPVVRIGLNGTLVQDAQSVRLVESSDEREDMAIEISSDESENMVIEID